ncbi:MAG: carboxypeptidase-like regulatory domain-containing protein [Gemmatimonadaceae bacterium]
MTRLTGAVRWSGTTTGVSDAEVRLIKSKTTRAKASTDPEGRFAFDNVKEGKGYSIRVTALGAIAVTTATFEVGAGTNRQNIELQHSAVSTTTTSTTATTLTTSTDTRTIMGTTATVSTDTTTTDTTTTGTTTTGTTTTGTTTTDSSTTSSSTTATTGTTATTATIAPTASGGLPAGSTAFDDLDSKVANPRFDRDAAVNIEEARQFRRLYTVTNYMLARVPGAIGGLNTLLNTPRISGSTPTNTSTLPLRSTQALIDNHQATIDSILARASDNTRTEAKLFEAARAQFDLGTAATPNVNVTFKTLFREFVGLAANDLLGVDPNNVTGRELTEQQKKEELFNVFKRTKRALLRLVENMSIAGTLGSASLIEKWSRLLTDSLGVLVEVGQFVGDDDNDRRHIWSIVAELNQIPKASIDAYIVHAREGGTLLGDAIEAYQQLGTKLTSEDQAHLRDFFFDSAKYSVKGETISARFRRNALLIQENWIAAWN